MTSRVEDCSKPVTPLPSSALEAIDLTTILKSESNRADEDISSDLFAWKKAKE
jgi:hypothetical protein